jgi:hypothetical protein
MDILTTLPTDSVVTAAFAELLEDVTSLLTAAQAQKPLDKEEISFWRRQLNALNKAEYNWKQGVRPVLSDSAYLLASASRPGALVHRLTKQGSVALCSCEAGQKGILCWHHQLICVVERAAELESAATKEEAIGGGGPEMTPEAAAAQLLRARLEATAQIIDAMREQQQRPPIVHLGSRLAAARRVFLEAA